MNKIFALAAIFAVLGGVFSDDICVSKSTNYCNENNKFNFDDCKESCNAKVGDIEYATQSLQEYANELFDISFDYLFVAANFGTYTRNRPGFEKTFKELSDSKWNKGIEMIKYMSKRGASHNFNKKYVEARTPFANNYSQYEVQAMVTALDTEKHLFTKANEIHKKTSHPNRHSKNPTPNGFDKEKSVAAAHYDAEIAHYIDENILEYSTENIRKFSGHVNDLHGFSKPTGEIKPDISMALYLFDQTL